MFRSIFFIAVCVSATLAVCDYNDLFRLAKCYTDFVGFYGFKFDGNLPAYWDMHDARGAMIVKGQLTVQPKICDVANALVNCTAPIVNYDKSCLLSFGVNASDAQDYFTDRAVGGYQCGPGYNTMMKDFYCIGATRSAKHDALEKCSDDLNNTIKKGGDVCGAENTFIMCQAKIYADGCDYNAGVFMCGVNRAGINANNQYCEQSGKMMKCPAYTLL